MSWKFALRVVAILLGGLSLAVMSVQGLQLNLNKYCEAVLQIYDDLATFIFAHTLEVALRYLLDFIHKYTPLKLQIYPHWKYIFILLWLDINSKAKISDINRPDLARKERIVGLPVALLTGVGAGLFSLDNPVLFIIPIVGYCLFGLIYNSWSGYGVASTIQGYAGHYPMAWDGIAAILAIIVAFFLAHPGAPLLALILFLFFRGIRLFMQMVLWSARYKTWSYFIHYTDTIQSMHILSTLGCAMTFIILGHLFNF
jgi:hypothetical protein